jgi:restriction system protein
MAIPDFQSCMRPLLAAISDGQTHPFNPAFEEVCRHFDLSADDINERLPSGKQTVIRNRVSWSRTFMKKAGLLVQPQRAHMQITELGQKALQDCPDRIDVKYLKQFESFREFHQAKPQAATSNNNAQEIEETTDPVERLEQAHSEIQQELIDELLITIKLQSPQFLEGLVVELMQAMGYGGWSKESGNATQYTADGGIDGIINEDPLGLETIYLQAKRYTDNSIGRPDVQAFAGALDMQRAKKGVFITTSKFSRDALEFVGMIEKKIILIDGQKLAELMTKHNVGVATKDTYHVKTIDTDYFTED